MAFDRGGIAAVALLGAALGIVPARAQDVAEAARQARERKAQQQNPDHHVYTDDDLKKARILTPEDAQRAALNQAVPATVAKQESQPDGTKKDQLSLGEVARAYRREKAEGQAEQATRGANRSHYKLDLPKTSLAEPRPEVGPGRGSLSGEELRPMRPGFSVPAERRSPRFSPFTPRPVAVPAPPVAPPPLAAMVGTLRKELVRPGDTWWKLARRSVGAGARWEELLRVNPGINRDPKKLKPGIYVFVPQSPPTRGSPAGSSIVVQKGDTLWSLAREHLGCSLAWRAIAAANPALLDANDIQIGLRLNLPDSPAAGCPAGTRVHNQN